MPTPRKGEKESDFIGRCMADPEAQRTKPDQKERLGFCYGLWRQAHKDCAHTTHMIAADGRVWQRDADPSGSSPISTAWRTEVRARLARAEQQLIRMVTANEGEGLSRADYQGILNKVLGGDWFKKYLNQAYMSGINNAATKLGVPAPAGLSRADRAAIASLSKTVQGDFKDVFKELSKQLHANVKDAASLQEAISALQDRVAAIGGARGAAVAAVNTIAANAEAALAFFGEMGVDQVGVQAESEVSVIWQTAGDDAVCPECEAMEGKAFSLEEADGLIPLHPNCRCAWVPLEFNINFEGARK